MSYFGLTYFKVYDAQPVDATYRTVSACLVIAANAAMLAFLAVAIARTSGACGLMRRLGALISGRCRAGRGKCTAGVTHNVEAMIQARIAEAYGLEHTYSGSSASGDDDDASSAATQPADDAV